MTRPPFLFKGMITECNLPLLFYLRYVAFGSHLLSPFMFAVWFIANILLIMKTELLLCLIPRESFQNICSFVLRKIHRKVPKLVCAPPYFVSVFFEGAAAANQRSPSACIDMIIAVYFKDICYDCFLSFFNCLITIITIKLLCQHWMNRHSVLKQKGFLLLYWQA